MKIKSILCLFTTALIWGLAFVAQDVAMDDLPPATFNAIRMFLASVALFIVSLFINKKKSIPTSKEINKTNEKNKTPLLLAGLLTGLCLGAGSLLQQWGISLDSGVGKAGFISALYIVIVPIIHMFLGEKQPFLRIIAVIICAIGLYFLCIQSNFTFAISDIIIMISSFCFALHILVIDYFSNKVDCLKMSCIQSLVASLLSLIVVILFENPTISAVYKAIIPILYAGILSGALGYTLQMVAQQHIDPTLASLILCLESVVAVLAGLLLLGETMVLREYIGCFLMLIGIILATLPPLKKRQLK